MCGESNHLLPLSYHFRILTEQGQILKEIFFRGIGPFPLQLLPFKMQQILQHGVRRPGPETHLWTVPPYVVLCPAVFSYKATYKAILWNSYTREQKSLCMSRSPKSANPQSWARATGYPSFCSVALLSPASKIHLL